MHKRASIVSVFLVAVLPYAASADPLCRQLDVPGSASTQIWQINNADELAVTSDLGPYIYSAGKLQPLPDAPIYAPDNWGAYAVDDAGTTIVGSGILSTTGNEESFILRDNQYSFFDYPSADFPNTNARAVNDAGVIAGIAYGNGVVGFVYNPNGAPGWAPGFTTIVGTLPSGQQSRYNIANAINARGQVVGSARFNGQSFGFIYDPAASPPMTLFQVDGTSSGARGINNVGQIAGNVLLPSGTIGFVRDASGDHLFSCPELAASNLAIESINDAGIISGGFFDAQGTSHGLVVYPDVATLVNDLRAAVGGLGPGRSLVAKLDAALSAVAAGDKAGACDDLGAFTSELSAQSGKQVPTDIAASLGDEAAVALRGLGCQ